MTSLSRPLSTPWTLVATAAIALALAGCGRKGPLDPPPNALAPVAEQGEPGQEHAETRGTVFDPTYGANALPATPRGSKRSFVLDPLLNSD